MLLKKIVLFLFVVCSSTFVAQADLLIFSKDRPLQLDALLESIELNVTGLNKISVLYLATDDAFENGYKIVQQRYPNIVYIAQSRTNPRNDFKQHTIRILFGNHTVDYVMMAVDDIVVKQPINIVNDIKLLQQTGAYGMYYRLGKHVDYCYTMNCYQGIPPLTPVGHDCYSWQFKNGKYDWNYPNTTDMCLYKKESIYHAVTQLNYHSPNTFEGIWSTKAPKGDRLGLCHTNALMVNLPLNMVQVDCDNRHMELSAAFLLEKYEQGLKMDIKPLATIKNNAAHMEYQPTFIVR